MGFESVIGPAIGAVGGLFGGGHEQGHIQTSIVIPPRPDLTGANEPQLQAATGGMLSAAAPFAQYGAGYQLLPQQMLGQVYVPGPNPTLMGDPYAQQSSYFGPSAAPPPGPAANVADTGGAGKGMGVSPPIGGNPALNSLFQLAQNSSGPVSSRPSNRGGA